MANSPSGSPESSGSPHGEPRIVSQTTALAVQFQGPLPPPVILEHYERIVPGSAARIISMAENQSNHRQTLERRVINLGCITQPIGQLFALIIALRSLAAASEMVKAGYSAKGVALVIFKISTFAAVFIYGKQAGVRERRKRAEQEQSS